MIKKSHHDNSIDDNHKHLNNVWHIEKTSDMAPVYSAIATLLLEKPQYDPVFITSDMIDRWTLPTTGDELKPESSEYAWL